MSLHLLGAQISTTLWRSKIEDMTGDVLCLKSGSKGIFTVCRSAVSFLCSAVSKLSKDFASWLCLHRSTFTGSKRALKRAMVLSSTSGLYLHYSTTPYLWVQKSDTIVLCCCFDKHFKNCISASATFLESVQNHSSYLSWLLGDQMQLPHISKRWSHSAMSLPLSRLSNMCTSLD